MVTGKRCQNDLKQKEINYKVDQLYMVFFRPTQEEQKDENKDLKNLSEWKWQDTVKYWVARNTKLLKVPGQQKKQKQVIFQDFYGCSSSLRDSE